MIKCFGCKKTKKGNKDGVFYSENSWLCNVCFKEGFEKSSEEKENE